MIMTTQHSSQRTTPPDAPTELRVASTVDHLDDLAAVERAVVGATERENYVAPARSNVASPSTDAPRLPPRRVGPLP